MKMKKISRKFQTALLRGAVWMSGSMAVVCCMAFCNDIYGVIAITIVGAGTLVCINDCIK